MAVPDLITIVNEYKINNNKIAGLSIFSDSLFKIGIAIKNLANIIVLQSEWERSSVWLERMPVTHEVASSSLVVPAILNRVRKGSFFNG